MADGNMGTIWYEVEARTGGLVNAERQISDSMDRMSQQMRQTDQAATRLNQNLSRLAGAVKLVVAGSALRQIAGMVQSYQEMSERVQMATSSQAEFEAVQRRLLTTANGTYRSLAEAQELYIQTADSLRSMGYSTQQALDVTDSMSYAFVTNATNAQRAQSAINAFSGAVTTGRVTADQWRTVTSAIPSVINDIATASGKSSAEVRRLGATGKLTAQQLTEGLRRALDQNSEAAAGMANNLTDAGVRARTALAQILVAAENQTGALQALTEGIISAADALVEFGGDSDRMAGFLNAATTAAAAYASVIAGRLIMSIGTYATAQYRALQATLQRNAAEANAALGATRRAAAERAAAMQALAVAQAEFNAARGTNAHAFAAQALTAARVRAAAATQAYAQAQAAANRVATVGAMVMGRLRSAMAFLGGPAGVILLASTALYTFARSAQEAKPPIDYLSESVNELHDATLALRETQLSEIIDDFQVGPSSSLQITNARLETLRKNLEEFPNSKMAEQWRREIEEQSSAAGEASIQIEEYRKQLARIQEERARRAAGGERGDSVELTPPELDSGAKKAAEELRRAQEQNASTLNDLAQELALANLNGRELAQTQAVLGLNSYATQGDIDSVRALAGAVYDLEQAERNRELLNQTDPIANEQNRYKTQLDNFKQLKEAQLLEEYRYQELVAQAEMAHAENVRRIQEANFAAQSRGNALLIDSLNALQSAGTSALSGLLAGTTSSTEAMQMLANAILNEVIGSFVEMGIAQVKAWVMGRTAQAAAAAGYISSVVGQVAANTALAAQAAFASTAAIPVVGPALAPAAAATAASAASALGAPAVSAASATLAGGRQYGGPVAAGSMYRINETGAPEVFNAANGKQFMLANTRGEVVSNADARSGGQINVIINNNAPVDVRAERRGDDVTITVDDVRRIVASDIARGGTVISNSFEQTYNTRRGRR